jgi:hypothetical protein
MKKLLSVIGVSFLLLFHFTKIINAEVDYSAIKDKETVEIIKKASSVVPNPHITGKMLLFEDKFTVKNQNQAVFKRHVIIKILREAGKGIGFELIPYNEYFEKVKLTIARTIQPDGSIQNVSQDAIKDESLYASLPFYSDIKIKKITFPNVQVGSIIEYEVEFLIDIKSKLGFSYIFTIPTNWTFSLIKFSAVVPKNTPVKFKAERFMNNEPTITSSGNNDVYTWQMEHVWSKGSDEAAAANFMKTRQYVLFSTIKDWSEVNSWTMELMKNQAEPDEAIKTKVHELVADLKEDQDRIIQALSNYVSSQIRYVAIELGMSAYKPYAAADVFKNAYGDCKGKSILLIAMLKAAGIQAYPALLMTSDGGFVIKDIPTFDFNHMIVAVPNGADYKFIDPTADMLAFDKIPYPNQGCDVFILTENKKEDFVYLPIDTPETNKISRTCRLVLKRDLSAEGEEEVILSGQPGWLYRYMAKSTAPEVFKEIFEKAAKFVIPGFNLKKLTCSDYNDLANPFQTKSSFTINNYSTKSDNLLIFQVPLSDPLPSSLFLKTPRESALELRYPFVQENNTTIILPEGYTIKTIPKNLNLDKPEASYKVEYQIKGNKILINENWVLKTAEVSVGRYGVFRSLMQKISNANKENIVLEEKADQTEKH